MATGVGPGATSRCQTIFTRTRRNEGADVGDRDQDLHGPARERLGDRELVKVARIVVVDGAPEAPAQIADVARASAVGGEGCRRVEARDLGQGVARKIRLKAAIEHRLVGDGAQNLGLRTGEASHRAILVGAAPRVYRDRDVGRRIARTGIVCLFLNSAGVVSVCCVQRGRSR